MEETDIRIAELKRSAYEFRRDIVVGAENPRTGKTMAEKVLSWMEAKVGLKLTYVLERVFWSIQYDYRESFKNSG